MGRNSLFIEKASDPVWLCYWELGTHIEVYVEGVKLRQGEEYQREKKCIYTEALSCDSDYNFYQENLNEFPKQWWDVNVS